MGGEGWCEVFEKSTWYGNAFALDCPYFRRRIVLKGDNDETH